MLSPLASVIGGTPASMRIEPVIEPSRARATDAGGARLRAGALAPPPETGKRLGNGAADSGTTPSRPALAALETDVRQKLADRDDWLTGANLVARDATSLTLSVRNEHQADNVRRFFGADILGRRRASAC